LLTPVHTSGNLANMADSTWMEALAALIDQGLSYQQIGLRVGASSRSVRRWDLCRRRVLAGEEHPLPKRMEARPLPVYASALQKAATSTE
jgi:hypothetical protein